MGSNPTPSASLLGWHVHLNAKSALSLSLSPHSVSAGYDPQRTITADAGFWQSQAPPCKPKASQALGGHFKAITAVLLPQTPERQDTPGDAPATRRGAVVGFVRCMPAAKPQWHRRTSTAPSLACRIAIAGIADPSSSDDIGESHRSCALDPLQGHTGHYVSGCGMKTRKVRPKVGTFRDWCQTSVGAGAPAAGTVSMVTVRSFSRSSISVPSTFHSASPQLTLALNGSGGTSNSVAYSVMCCWPR